jgi:hypothetical protein
MRDSNLYTLLIRPSNIPAESATPSSHTDIIHLVERRDGSEEPRYTRVKKRVDEERIAKGVDPGAYEAELLGAREKVVGQGKQVVDPWFYYYRRIHRSQVGFSFSNKSQSKEQEDTAS